MTLETTTPAAEPDDSAAQLVTEFDSATSVEPARPSRSPSRDSTRRTTPGLYPKEGKPMKRFTRSFAALLMSVFSLVSLGLLSSAPAAYAAEPRNVYLILSPDASIPGNPCTPSTIFSDGARCTATAAFSSAAPSQFFFGTTAACGSQSVFIPNNRCMTILVQDTTLVPLPVLWALPGVCTSPGLTRPCIGAVFQIPADGESSATVAFPLDACVALPLFFPVNPCLMPIGPPNRLEGTTARLAAPTLS